MMNSSRVLEIFKEITTIPRESGHEEKITAWLMNWAKSHGFEAKEDDVHNVCIVKKASKGYENSPIIVLQAHQDMVCEKNSDSGHDFAVDPIPYVIEDGWMVAKETTLGADDGIGIAAALAVLEDTTPMGKIECVFTISEETGMDGADGMKAGFFEGKTLINLDSEDEGQLFIGCAGGLNTRIRLDYNVEDRNCELDVIELKISGGIGGHSGDDINKGRMNAVQQMARFLYTEFSYGIQLFDLDGGGKPNAIARECTAIISVPDYSRTLGRFKKFAAAVKEEFHTTDADIRFDCVRSTTRLRAVDRFTAMALISSLFTCPHGVQAMSQDIPDLVQTSTNLASVHRRKRFFEIVTSQRSPAESERRSIAAKVRANFEAVGADVRHMYEYPGWNPNPDSPILKYCVDSYIRLFNQEPEVKAIHAGLECGLFLEKFPGLDMISFGPTLRGVHAPGEKMEMASLDKFVALLFDVVCHYK